ncbi:DUF3048 domain-containing protein [Alkalibacillus aidingensis]|uniref:DUF3048 domain-containing protein n=1 Tax=Alkalibacillus aidingensis TaxID=2747607 RepID=UPI00166017BB|nr:DUF3048 domain-containing protein [Alkalibacillus aidingensis]
MQKWFVAIVASSLLFLGACNEEEGQLDPDEPEEVDEEEIESVFEETEDTEDEEEEITESEFTYPLTGEDADQEYDRRTLAVQINNHPSARPQTGLVHADYVYEFLAEGDITRLVALYHSNIPEVVGPVRSARSYYIETAKSHGAIYIYHGAASFIEEELRAGWVTNLNGAYYDDDQFLFKRESFRSAPHNSYVMLENAYDVANRNGIEIEQDHKPLSFMSKSDVEKVTGDQAKKIDIEYYSHRNVSYDYDEELGGYYRYSDGEQTVDLDTEEPMVVENILVFEAPHDVVDEVGRRDIDIESGGSGYLIQQGNLKEVDWQTVNGIMTPHIDGEVVDLVPGQTWVNVVPTSPGLEQTVTYQ